MQGKLVTLSCGREQFRLDGEGNIAYWKWDNYSKYTKYWVEDSDPSPTFVRVAIGVRRTIYPNAEPYVYTYHDGSIIREDNRPN